MSLIKKIIVSDSAKNSLISREIAVALFKKIIGSESNIEFDFTNIEFISRSFADQFYKLKIEYEQNQNSKIQIVNANENVINMLDIVSQTQNSTNREFQPVPIIKFSNSEMLSDYLFSI